MQIQHPVWFSIQYHIAKSFNIFISKPTQSLFSYFSSQAYTNLKASTFFPPFFSSGGSAVGLKSVPTRQPSGQLCQRVNISILHNLNLEICSCLEYKILVLHVLFLAEGCRHMSNMCQAIMADSVLFDKLLAWFILPS